MKIHLRTLYADTHWRREEEKESLREFLNSLGFYVLHGVDDTLEVYAVSDKAWWEL